MIRKLASTISKKFHDRKLSDRNIVPHITLVGTLHTDDEKKLISEAKNVTSKFDLVGFKFNNFGMFLGRAVYVRITPSAESW